MATVRTPATPSDGPPDVRGPTAPLPAAVLGVGAAAIALVLGGTVVLQILWAISGGSLTPECLAVGLTPKIIGARGVCNIVTALASTAQSTLLLLGLILGIAAIAVGFTRYRRMDTKRKREECITGAGLGIQAVLLAGFLQWFRAGTPEKFVRQFLNFDLLHGTLHGFLVGAK